tara:strand:- start:1443 stop:1871 length:429 start_codon:yes stop_codon:yes gene_type:complete
VFIYLPIFPFLNSTASAFESVLSRLPFGLKTDIREKGVTLSGGERQRLALARGLLAARKSSILLLDEPTSSVDIMNERHIYQHIFDSFKEKTLISSLHRLHLLNEFDTIIVMNQGKIEQIGSFTSLLNQRGLFQKIWKKHGM